MILMGLMVLAAWVMRDRFHPVIAGQPAPSFAATTLTGEPVTLEDWEGDVLLLNIWATWCLPCRTEMPSMQSLYEQVGHEDFQILAVSVDAEFGERDFGGNEGSSEEQIVAFAEELGLTFPILRDPSGEIQRIYQTTGVPESFIVGRDGVIYRRLAGPTTWDHPSYQKLIQDLLEG